MVEMTVASNAIAGIVLAGGRSQRLGGDKALKQLGMKPLLAHAITRAAPQAASLALSVNTDPASFRSFGLPLLADPVPGFPGPLAGIPVALDWTAQAGTDILASFACDAPFFPLDLVARHAAARDADHAAVAWAASGSRASRLRTLAGVVARGLAPCLVGAGGAQGRCLGRALPLDAGLISDRAVPSVFQHQRVFGFDESGAIACNGTSFR